nr:SulP family inorganic anion transporter [Actinomadura soli]
MDGNQELLALGASNIGAGFFHGFPVSSSGSRTALAAASGGRTQLYSFFSLTALVAVLLFLHPLLARFPSAAQGAIVIYAAVRLVDLAGFRRLAAFRRSELLLAVAALAGVLAFGILYGILVAVGLSVMMLLARVARPHDAILGQVPGMAGMHDVDDFPTARTIPGLVVYRYDSPLIFANATDFKRRALAAARKGGTGVRWFVLNAEANVEVDLTGLKAVEALRSELCGRGSSSRWHGSSKTSSMICAPSGSRTRSATTGCSPLCRRRSPRSNAGTASTRPRTSPLTSAHQSRSSARFHGRASGRPSVIHVPRPTCCHLRPHPCEDRWSLGHLTNGVIERPGSGDSVSQNIPSGEPERRTLDESPARHQAVGRTRAARGLRRLRPRPVRAWLGARGGPAAAQRRHRLRCVESALGRGNR